MTQKKDSIIKDITYVSKRLKRYSTTSNYWILVKETCLTGELTRELVITVHPFTWRQKINPQLPDLSIQLLNWKEITKEEYELYNTI